MGGDLAASLSLERSPGRIHLVNSANAYLLCVGNVMEQMRLELTSKRMSGHGVVLSLDIFHAMILMRIYGAVITFVVINI